MAFQPVPDTVQANVRFIMAGVPAENTYYFKRTGGYSEADITALAEAIAVWAEDETMTLRNTATTLNEVYVKGLEFAEDVQNTASAPAGIIGTQGLGQANNVTKAFTLRSGLTGRSSRGRSFWIGMSGIFMTETDAVDAGFVEDVIAALESLKVIIEALGWIWVIVSRYTGGVLRPAGVTFPIASFGVSDLTLDSMRGRLD